MIIKNSTVCSHFSDIMTHKLQQIKNTQRLLYDIAQGGEGDIQEDCLTSYVNLVRHCLALWMMMTRNFIMIR